MRTTWAGGVWIQVGLAEDSREACEKVFRFKISGAHGIHEWDTADNPCSGDPWSQQGQSGQALCVAAQVAHVSCRCMLREAGCHHLKLSRHRLCDVDGSPVDCLQIKQAMRPAVTLKAPAPLHPAACLTTVALRDCVILPLFAKSVITTCTGAGAV